MSEIINAKVDHIKLFSIDLPKPLSKTIIVGNAYGIMPYIKPLAIELAKNNIQPFWFAFSGQENTEGSFSHKQCVKDLELIYHSVSKKNELEINFLSHCAGSLMTLEFLRKNKNLRINKLIIYGLLYNMNRRRNIAERKLNSLGVKFDLSDQDWQYNPLEAIYEIEKEIFFVHSKDKINLERATTKEMALVNEINSKNKIMWFDNGYDEDLNEMNNFTDIYTSYLNS